MDDARPTSGSRSRSPKAAAYLSGIVVDPEWLEGHLDDPDLRVVDLRQAGAYGRGHVPGAVHLDLAALGTSRPDQDNVLLRAGPFSELMAELGVSEETTVVAYDDQWGLAAARFLWALNYYGHDEVAVLDGGWDRWSEERRPVSDAVEAPARGRFAATPQAHLGATREWLLERLGGPSPVLVDTRSGPEFERGHLPGAVSWDWFNAVPPEAWDVARDLDDLRSEWRALGVEPERDVVVYCRSGMRAAHTYMVLKHAGYPNVRLYDGSWQEWSTSGTEDDNG